MKQSTPFKRLKIWLRAIDLLSANVSLDATQKRLAIENLRSPIGPGKARGKKARRPTGIAAARRAAKKRRNARRARA